MPGMLAHPTVSVQCKVHCPWAPFHETMVLLSFHHRELVMKMFSLGNIMVTNAAYS